MKAYFRAGLLLALLGVAPLACYSVEFHPDPDYPNRRRGNVETVELRRTAPSRPYERLGELVVRDSAADLSDENFRGFLEREIRERGAEGGWIERRRPGQTTFETRTQTSPYSQYSPTGQLEMATTILTVVLFNYLPAEEEHP